MSDQRKFQQAAKILGRKAENKDQLIDLVCAMILGAYGEQIERLAKIQGTRISMHEIEFTDRNLYRISEDMRVELPDL